MKSFSIYIVDDDISFCLEVEMILEKLGYNIIGQASTFEKAKVEIKSLKPDLIISDMALDDGKNGVMLAECVKDLAIPFIFMTSYNDVDHYDQSKKYPKSKFIVKPFDKLTLKGLIDDYITTERLQGSDNYILNDRLFIKHTKKFENVAIKDIYYLESEGNYCYIHTKEKKYVHKGSLTRLLESPSFSHIFRIHRNFAVYLNRVKTVSFNNKVLTINDKELPIGKSYTKSTREIIMKSKV